MRTSHAALYRRMVAADVRSTMEYPASFAVGAVTNVVLVGLDLVAVLAVFANVDRFAGWSLADALVLYGLAQATFYLGDLAVGQVEDLPRWIRSGRLDVLFLRPRPVLLQVLSSDVDLRSLGKVLYSVGVLAVALAGAGIDWTAGRVALLAVALVAGPAIYAALFVATNSITFWLVDSREVASAFTYGGRTFAGYPLGIYSQAVRHVAHLVVPIAFTAYYPTLGLLGRDDPLGGPAGLAWAGPPVAVAAMAAAGLVWRTGIRSYRSTGA